MKRPKPWYRASKSAWYVEHNHKQHRLGEHPEGGGPVQVFAGRYGPYVKFGKINATLPKTTTPETVTLAEAVALIESKAKNGKGGTARRPARKAAAAKKPAKKAETTSAGKSAKKAPAKTAAKRPRPPAKPPDTA